MGVAADTEGLRSKKPSLEPLTKLVADDLKAVNEVILARMDSPVQLIPQLAGHVISAGGKRIRPMLTLASSKLCGHGGRRHIGLAACVEFIHTATLLHDDVVDDSDLRRGLASANVVWGNKSSVLVGDFLFSRAFELMVEDGSLEVLAILSQASSTIAEGEVMQLVTTSDLDTDEAAYLAVVRAKTAKLFAAACRIGAVVADRPTADADALEAFGMNLGIAFQLVDDVLDFSAHQQTLGKTIGDDFREGKMTLPVIRALAAGDAGERQFWQRTIEDLDQNEGDLETAVELLTRNGCLKGAMERARGFGRTAMDDLAPFPAGREKDALFELVEFCIDRVY